VDHLLQPMGAPADANSIGTMPSSKLFVRLRRPGAVSGLTALCATLSVLALAAQTGGGSSEYHFYAGSTHAHTSYTWSHGDQFVKADCGGIMVYAPKPGSSIETWTDGYVKSKTGCAGIFVIDGAQYPSPSMKVKANWEEDQ
jgi:hypothetical protein